MLQSRSLGEEPISKLLIKQSVPAAIGFLIMSINSIVDAIFVGRYVGFNGIAAISVVMPISFFISSIGMAIGIGGASIISRALGSDDPDKANRTFSTQAILTLSLSAVLLLVGYTFQDEVLGIFGGKGDILPPAKVYFNIVLFGTPFLAWAMMSNNVIRAEGKAKVAMMVMILSAVVNIILDPIFIIGFGWGMYGAGWATTLAYVTASLWAVYFFSSGKNEVKLKRADQRIDLPITKEIFSIGGVTLVRQGSVSVLIAILNLTLFKFGGETAVATYGIISRLMMFTLFPVIGVVQGFMPIVGYNYGAGLTTRVKETVVTAIKYGSVMASLIFLVIISMPEKIVWVFTTDPILLKEAPRALVFVYLATPLITLQLIGAAYFQAIGKALPALLLTLTKQAFFLIPLVLILPYYFGLNGAWYSFPIADVLSTLITVIFLIRALKEVKKLVHKPQDESWPVIEAEAHVKA